MASFYHDAMRAQKNTKEHTLTIDTPGRGDMPPGFINNVSSLDVKPGYKLCVYDRAAQQTSGPNVKPYCFTEGVDDLGGSPPKVVRNPQAGWSWGDAIVSYSLLKDCSSTNFMWDDDCTYNIAERSTADCKDPSSACFTNRVTFCNTADVLSKECINFCKLNPGMCDQAMTKHCLANSTKDECACLASVGATSNPQCFDNRCANLGYKTKAMKEYQCPDSISCDTFHKYDGLVEFTDGTLEDRCKDTSKPVTTSTSSGTSWVGVIFMVLLIVFLALVFYKLFFSGGMRKGSVISGFNTDVFHGFLSV